MENEGSENILGAPDAPYLNSVANSCGSATNMFAEGHPSLPNYIAMTSGSTQGITDDDNPSSHPLSVPSIFSQLGTNWMGLNESMQTNCEQTNDGPVDSSGDPLYAVRHNPAAYYTNISAACGTQDIPLASGTTPNIGSAFTFITPNICDDMHDPCPNTNSDAIAYGDKWLSTFLPTLTDQAQYENGSTAIFITWDEDEDNGGDNQIPTLVISPYTPAGTTSNIKFNHYSMLRTAEQLLNLGYLGAASSANSMLSAFNLDGSLTPTSQSSSGTAYSPSVGPTLPGQDTNDTSVTINSEPAPVVTSKRARFSATIATTSPGTAGPSGRVTWNITSHSGASIACASGTDMVRRINQVTRCNVASGQLRAGDGPYKVSVTYPGGGNFTASAATVTQPVSRASSRTLVRVTPPASSGGSASITAVVRGLPRWAGTPSGTVTFSVSGASGQSVPCLSSSTDTLTSGTATCTLTTAASGGPPYTVKATYSGDSNFNASASNSRSIR